MAKDFADEVQDSEEEDLDSASYSDEESNSDSDEIVQCKKKKHPSSMWHHISTVYNHSYCQAVEDARICDFRCIFQPFSKETHWQEISTMKHCVD